MPVWPVAEVVPLVPVEVVEVVDVPEVPPFGHGVVEEVPEVPVVDVDVVEVVLELATCPLPPQVFELHVVESPFGHGVMKVVPILVKGIEGTVPPVVVVESVDVVSELETLPFPPEVVELHEVSVPELPPGHGADRSDGVAPVLVNGTSGKEPLPVPVLDVQEFPVVESPGHGVVEPVDVVEVDAPDTIAGHGVTLGVSDVVDVPSIPVLPPVVVVLVDVLSELGDDVVDVPSTPVLPDVVVESVPELGHGVSPDPVDVVVAEVPSTPVLSLVVELVIVVASPGYELGHGVVELV
ncbi:hypothetical protein BBJ28_00008466 [Nothophytophthora sp. Chile5]|nr:hypothetical protein BBJ28_00008466 [Nothophytophthora sp. Chile5]